VNTSAARLSGSERQAPLLAEFEPAPGKPRIRPGRLLAYAVLIGTSLLWLLPLLWAVYTSLRPYDETQRNGYVSVAHSLSFINFTTAWQQADFPHYFGNSIIVTIPAVLLTLLLASFVAFVVSRFALRYNVALLILFTAGNLLPQQVIITPVYKLFLLVPVPQWVSDSGTLYDSYLGLVLINVAFQVGFCAFILSNYMKTIPRELTEAALVDGASVWRQYWQVILPLCRPALGALGTLEFTFIYNDFFWATVLLRSGDKRPITSAIANLSGQYFTNNNLIAAAALITALPTLIIFFALQRQFVAGLTLGANKG